MTTMPRAGVPRAVCALLLAVLWSSLGQAPGPGPAAGATPILTRLQVGQVGGLSDAAIFIAGDKGFFREQGIELEMTRFNSAAQMVAPLATGQLDIGGGAPSAGLFNAIARSIPVKIVADKGNMSPGHGYEAIVIRKSLWDTIGVKSPADLRGRTVALAARDISPEVDLDAFLRTGGLTVSDVNVVTMGFPDMEIALANGSIDAALPIEPFVTQIAEKGIGVIWMRDDAVVPGQQVAAILYSPRFASYKPGLAKRFMLAYVRAARYYNDAFVKKDPAKKREVVQILMQHTPVKNPTLYDKMVMPGLNPNGHVNVERLAAMQDWFLRKGSQKSRVDLTKVVDNQYADWAVQQLGPYR